MLILTKIHFIFLYFWFFNITIGKDCQCGKYQTVTRYIVGGSGAKPHEFPWMALLLRDRKFVAGGSLINDRYILSAAHVVKSVRIDQLEVVLGVHNRITMDKRKPEFLKAEKYIWHPSSGNNNLIGDIGLIRLRNPVKYEDGRIWPICLPPAGKIFYDVTATVAGWGHQTYSGFPSRVLKKAMVKTMSMSKCEKTPIKEALSKIKSPEPDSMFCAIGWQVDSCQGDSGGPLMLEIQGSMAIIGIISYGIECAKPSYPGIYMNVGHYISWIIENTKDASYCSNPIH